MREKKEKKKQLYSLKSPQSCTLVRRGHNQQSKYRAPKPRTLAPAM
jgi:hypothetical protein